ncbi:hypothetical protein E3T61_16075 [Cryobacterium lactosi]|uniref:Uncharacterized protein n=1 Tax=Cryobacterium lactosi TaxID=1259202 RepID=A0A4R9BPJ8_9MICO|nr:hypothetical protein [Cryobacterium lactosi]TFD87325.1 hypothetical protein E3T61_16075 [Cryobacterium lactosi]
MQTKRLRLEGSTLPELQARVLAEHGDGARIIAAEQVTVGGIRGFFAKRHIEVTVEVPDAPVQVLVERGSQRRRAARVRDEMTTRLGIAALLDEADAAETLLRTDPASPRRAARESAAAPDVSTGTPDFARLMDELTFATSPARPPGGASAPDEPAESYSSVVPERSAEPIRHDPSDRPALSPGAPTMLDGPGDLILLLGLPDDVAAAARLLSAGATTPLYDERDQIDDRRSALAARARGVERGRSILVAHASGDPAALGADQVWAVVHAGRKPADTARWVRDAGVWISIDAVAVLGVDSTATPGTVLELGLPIGWLAPAGPPQPFAIG